MLLTTYDFCNDKSGDDKVPLSRNRVHVQLLQKPKQHNWGNLAYIYFHWQKKGEMIVMGRKRQ